MGVINESAYFLLGSPAWIDLVDSDCFLVLVFFTLDVLAISYSLLNLLLQRHMIMNYPEYNNVVSRLLFPKLAIADASAEHDVLWPADCASDSIELSRQLEHTPAFEPTPESPERPPIPMLQSEPVRQSGRNCLQFFSLSS